MGFLSQFFRSTEPTIDDYRAEVRQELLRKERNVTKDIFGALPQGTKRDFFCVDEHTWIWYEEWTDENGERKHMTSRYDVQTTGITKSMNGGPYKRISAQEARTFREATASYVSKVKKRLYANV